MLKASSPMAPKFFVWLQKLCSKHLGASTRPGLCNARWIKAIACVEQKRRNENEAHLMSKHFIDFHIFSDFSRIFDFFIMLKASSPVALKFFPWLQKLCSKHLGASTTSWLCTARWIKVIAYIGKKYAMKTKPILCPRILSIFTFFQNFKVFLNFPSCWRRQVALKFFLWFQK